MTFREDVSSLRRLDIPIGIANIKLLIDLLGILFVKYNKCQVSAMYMAWVK